MKNIKADNYSKLGSPKLDVLTNLNTSYFIIHTPRFLILLYTVYSLYLCL